MATPERLVLTDLQKLLLLASIVLGGWLLYQLSPVLMPFFIAAMLAYLGDPLVDKLESWNLSRTLSVTVVFCVFFLIALLLMLILVPLLSAQLAKLIQVLPTYLAKIQASLQPWLQSLGGASGQLDTDAIRQALSQYGSELSKVAGGLFTTMTRSGVVILQWLANLVLVPVLTFYLLRDWDVMVARFRELLPRRFATQVVDLSLECDEMLAGFLRGQLLVMFALAVIYCLGLSMIGLEFALLLGIIAGLVSFVPYLGLIVGIVLAGLAAYLQFGEWLPMLQVVIVFAVAQAIEGMLLTPRFVGERIGLHPVAVIFAVLAGGQLFGFIGVLLALPIAAIIAVLIRHAHQRYVSSELYS
jgi:sporulation integral membrane protein YtvI